MLTFRIRRGVPRTVHLLSDRIPTSSQAHARTRAPLIPWQTCGTKLTKSRMQQSSSLDSAHVSLRLAEPCTKGENIGIPLLSLGGILALLSQPSEDVKRHLAQVLDDFEGVITLAAWLRKIVAVWDATCASPSCRSSASDIVSSWLR